MQLNVSIVKYPDRPRSPTWTGTGLPSGSSTPSAVLLFNLFPLLSPSSSPWLDIQPVPLFLHLCISRSCRRSQKPPLRPISAYPPRRTRTRQLRRTVNSSSLRESHLQNPSLRIISFGHTQRNRIVRDDKPSSKPIQR